MKRPLVVSFERRKCLVEVEHDDLASFVDNLRAAGDCGMFLQVESATVSNSKDLPVVKSEDLGAFFEP